MPDYFIQFPSTREGQRSVIRDRLEELLKTIDAAPKTIGWKVRAKIGTRSRWYQEVSEKSRQY